MKVILSKKEKAVMDKMLQELTNKPLEENPGVMSIKYDDEEMKFNIEINEKYIITMYGKINEYLPALYSSVKGVVELFGLFANAVYQTENELFKELCKKEVE